MSEIKPCPFCGFVPTMLHIHADENQGQKWGSVNCDCSVRGPEVRTRYLPLEEWAPRAIAAWNERKQTGDTDNG